MSTISKHYGRGEFKGVLRWSQIRQLTAGMFTPNKYDNGATINGTKIENFVNGRSIHFYGNSGVCLFKYFVTSEDPQIGYSWLVIATNLVCFCLITVCYLLIQLVVGKSESRISTAGPGPNLHRKRAAARNRAMNQKIALMIGTDFICWIPFTIISLLHSFEVMDATPFYGVFSIIILPLNSVINPLLYENSGLGARLRVLFSRVGPFSGSTTADGGVPSTMGTSTAAAAGATAATEEL